MRGRRRGKGREGKGRERKGRKGKEREGEGRRGDWNIFLFKGKNLTNVIVPNHAILPLIHKLASVNGLAPPPVAHRCVAALAHKARDHAAFKSNQISLFVVGNNPCSVFGATNRHADTGKKRTSDA
jgi:hypothetical protein